MQRFVWATAWQLQLSTHCHFVDKKRCNRNACRSVDALVKPYQEEHNHSTAFNRLKIENVSLTDWENHTQGQAQ